MSLRFRVVVLVALVAACLFAYGCKGCTAGGEGEAVVPETEESSSGGTAGEGGHAADYGADPESGVGELYVNAAADFLKYDVINSEGEVVGSGNTRITTLNLPVGVYTVVVKPGGYEPVEIEGLMIVEGQKTTATLMGFASVTVKAQTDFLRYAVIDAGGNEIATGDTNIATLLLPVGEYIVRSGDLPDAKLVLEDGDNINFRSGW